MKTLLTFATVALAGLAFAGGPKEGRGPMRGPRGGMENPSDPVVRMVTNKKVAEKIGLSEEQKDKIKEINKANRNGAEDLHKALRAAMEKQTDLLKADKVDEAAVMAEIDKAFEARKELAKRQTRRVIAIKAVLTPEQVAKALEIAKDNPRGPKAKGPRGKGRGDCPKCDDGDKPEPPECDDGDKPEPPEKD